MKPRQEIAQSQCSSGLPLTLVEHDGRRYLEVHGRQVDAAHLGYSAGQLVSLATQPFRPARQPRILFLGLGFGHAVAEGCLSLPQERASFVVFAECGELPEWLGSGTETSPLNDPRIELAHEDPFSRLPAEYADSQAIVADLDLLEAVAPKSWEIESQELLAQYLEILKTGGLLGLLSHRPRTGLERLLKKVGFQLAVDQVPLSEKSKKNRTLYLARKGHYQRSH